ncbi:hypothetical protein EV385_3963 [Krasilnikovia cinnamomea]|uniref:Uncharacterized protein n=1 Tax=Krasilnikovia cinnamomea TaxID=349313 RepID=A0A4Q7ZMA4_9ACTN|nr:hypothetical protein [Krasilnikovia cinnamomea]RZU52122.1 hypothetical protein EV385_3963 [Krasilnikovia cinnamomea]
MLGTLTQRIERARTTVRRATLVPMLVRAGVAVCGLLAVTVAWPVPVLTGRFAVFIAAVAVYPALAPRGRGATVAAVAAVGGWILDTAWYDARVALWRVLALATLLYLAHTLTALAAVLPTDAEVDTDVVTGWLLRAGAVTLVSAVLTVLALGLTTDLAGGAFLVATLAGLAAAVGLTMLLARLLRRP